MSTVITAGTASNNGASISSDTSGNLSLVTGSSSQYTATVPQASGSVMVSGNMPAFSAFQNLGINQSVSAATSTKIILNTKVFDTNNNFDATTNYRFTPTIAGYYQINFGIRSDSTSISNFEANLNKSGSTVLSGSFTSTSTNGWMSTGSGILYLNGSTDYIELYVYSGTNSILNSAINYVFLNGSMIRGA